MFAAALALALALPSTARAAASFRGFTFPSWWKDAYDGAGAQKSLQDLAATGADSVAVIPTWYMENGESAAIAPTDQTASDASVAAVIRRAKSLGLRVVLKPHVNCRDGRPTPLIRPRDARAWFSSYRAFLLHYARLAAAERVDLLVVGTELFSMVPGRRADWEAMIGAARSVYGGPLTYAANWYDFYLVPFWDALDYVGVDGYFPMLGGADERALENGWNAYKPLLLAEARARGKPLLFTEVGIASQKGANRKPWDYRDFGPVDAATQTAYFAAFLKVFGREPAFAGFLQWCWDLDPAAGGPDDKSMTVQGKPALAVLEEYFRASRAAPPPPSRRAEAERAAARALAVLRAPLP